MINIRFHLVSLVAVFLALGIGVVMGTSFLDRATVDSMRGRVDDLEAGYRDRGDQIESYRDQLTLSDNAAAALGDDGSRATDAVLDGSSVVMLMPTGLQEGTAEVLADAVVAAGASVVGSIVLQPALDPQATDADLSDDQLVALEAVVDAAGSAGGDGDGEVSEDGGESEEGQGSGNGAETEDGSRPEDGPGAVEELLAGARSALAEALAVLSAQPPAPPDAGAGVTPAQEAAARTAELDAARGVVEQLAGAGLLVLETGGLPAGSAFPAEAGVRYLLVSSEGTEPSAGEWAVPFAEEYGAASAATMVVAGVLPLRPPGDLPDESVGEEDPVVVPLRTGAASDEVSTVENAAEPLARLSVVYALAAMAEGTVGHYGLGDGVPAPYPPAAQE